MTSDRHSLTNIGIDCLKRGEHDRALSIFKRLKPPIPVLAAVSWAALLVHRRRFSEALQILFQIDKPSRKKSVDELRDLVSCFIFREILQIISGDKLPRSSKIRGRGRLLRLMNPCILTSLRLLDAFGRLTFKFGFSSGRVIQKLVDSFRTQCWIYGFPIQPDFLEGELLIEKMNGYRTSLDVYRTVFLAYLDYWISLQKDIKDLLLASVKLEDALALYCIIREKRPSVVLEIGTFIGLSTCLMAQALKDNGKGMIYCIDPNLDYFSVNEPLSHARKMVNTLELDAWVRIHEGYFSEPRGTVESNVPVLGKRVSEIVPHIDLAFIDGDHMTTAVLQDFMLLLPNFNPHATVVFHDTKAWASVRQAIVILFQDDIFRQQMQFFEVSPTGYDGIGLIDVDRRKPLTEKIGIDKWTSGMI